MRSRSATVATLAVVTVLAAILLLVNVLAGDEATEPTRGPTAEPARGADRDGLGEPR